MMLINTQIDETDLNNCKAKLGDSYVGRKGVMYEVNSIISSRN